MVSFESKLYTIYEDQKLEYRDYVMKMYHELQSRGVDGVSPVAGHPPKILEEGRALISAIIQQLEKAPSSEMLLVDPSAIAQDTTVEEEEKDSDMPGIVMVTSEEAEFERKLKDLLEMGFSANDGEAALKMHNGQMVFKKRLFRRLRILTWMD